VREECIRYQGKTAGENHGDYERLEVAMFDKFVHETAASPPDATSQGSTDHVTELTRSSPVN